MANRVPMVMGSDGLMQQHQAADTAVFPGPVSVAGALSSTGAATLATGGGATSVGGSLLVTAGLTVYQSVTLGGNIIAGNISTTASSANVTVDGSGTFYKSTSSLAYKTDVELIDEAYANRFLAVDAIWYRSLATADNPAWSWYSFPAEGLAAVDPRLVQFGFQEDQLEDYEVVAATPATDRDAGSPAIMGRRAKVGEQPRPDGVQDRAAAALHHVIIQRHERTIAELSGRLAALEAKFAA